MRVLIDTNVFMSALLSANSICHTVLDIVVEMADIKDQPILNVAIEHGIDILVSGDKHFLSLEIEMPEILAPREFLLKYQ